MYLGQEKSILICVVNKTQVAGLSRILNRYPRSFAIMDQVIEVMGNFKTLDDHGKQIKEMLDHGDGQTL